MDRGSKDGRGGMEGRLEGEVGGRGRGTIPNATLAFFFLFFLFFLLFFFFPFSSPSRKCPPAIFFEAVSQ